MPQRPPTGRAPVVQARALATREKLLDRAEVAFARHGFDAASLTTDILEPAGVSAGSFYHQFGNKTDLLIALIDERLTVRRERLISLLADCDSFTECFRSAIFAVMDEMDASSDAFQVQYRERHHPDPAIRSAVESVWEVWRRAGRALVEKYYTTTTGRADSAAHLTIFVASGLVRDYLDAVPDERFQLRAMVLSASDYCAAGVERIVTG